MTTAIVMEVIARLSHHRALAIPDRERHHIPRILAALPNILTASVLIFGLLIPLWARRAEESRL